MKKLTTIFFFALLANRAAAQPMDTLAYLKTFEQQKAQYIGQPLSVLLNAMGQVQPKSVTGGRNIRQKNQIPFSMFYFVNPNNISTSGVIYMIIDWQTPISRTNMNYYINRNHYHFTNEERQFYGTKIIKDVLVYVKH